MAGHFLLLRDLRHVRILDKRYRFLISISELTRSVDLHSQCPSLARETFMLTRLGESIEAPESLYRPFVLIMLCFVPYAES